MPIVQVPNPTAAFYSSAGYGGQNALFGVIYATMTNTNGNSAGTIKANSPVLLDVVSAAWTPITNEITGALTSSNNKYLFGIAMDTIIAGATGRIATYGAVQATMGTGGVTAADSLNLDTTTAGRLITAPASPVVVNTTIGVALATTSAGALGFMLVNKA